jgi:aspartate/methionine/tyrosine aminotransferase
MSSMSALIDRPVRYDLAESTSPALRLRDLGGLPDLTLGYGTSRGDEHLRALIAASCGVGAGDVLVTVGAIEAMYLVAQATCGPGDHVLLATPCFPPTREVPERLGAKLDLVPLSFDEGYRLPLDRIAAAVTPQTRLISLASPQNPAGVRVSAAELDAVLDLAPPHAVVVVDETYRASTYGDAPVPESAASRSPRVVTCSSLSKAHGAPGLRLGWLTTTDPELYERLRDAKFVSTVACSTVDEALAATVLRQAGAILGARAVRLRAALDELIAWTGDQPVEIVVPDGGALCCLRLSATDPGDFYERLAAADTRVAPGSWFGESDRVFRVGFGHLPPADFTEALSRLGAALPAS